MRGNELVPGRVTGDAETNAFMEDRGRFHRREHLDPEGRPLGHSGCTVVSWPSQGRRPTNYGNLWRARALSRGRLSAASRGEREDVTRSARRSGIAHASPGRAGRGHVGGGPGSAQPSSAGTRERVAMGRPDLCVGHGGPDSQEDAPGSSRSVSGGVMAVEALVASARALRSRSWLLGTWQTQIRDTHQRASLLSFWDLIPMRAEPLRKKKKVDPKKDQAVKDRLKKRIRRLEKASQELIPIEDFITPVKLLDKARQRPHIDLPFEESERRALLLKKWSLYKHQEHEMERDAIRSMLEAQQEALQELQLMSPELHAEATKRDPSLFPFEKEGPDYTPPVSNYQPPEGRYHDITKVYTQVEFKK